MKYERELMFTTQLRKQLHFDPPPPDEDAHESRIGKSRTCWETFLHNTTFARKTSEKHYSNSDNIKITSTLMQKVCKQDQICAQNMKIMSVVRGKHETKGKFARRTRKKH